MPKPLLITGRPGSGKTTVVQRVVRRILAQGWRVQGFYTLEVRQKGRRVGFDLVTVPDGIVVPLARVGPGMGPRVGRYQVFVEPLEARALPLLEPGPAHLLVIDEIGAMELLSHRFRQRILELLEKPPTCLLATIQEKQVPRLLGPGLRERVELWTLRFGQAEEMTQRVLSYLKPCGP